MLTAELLGKPIRDVETYEKLDAMMTDIIKQKEHSQVMGRLLCTSHSHNNGLHSGRTKKGLANSHDGCNLCEVWYVLPPKLNPFQ